VSAFASGRAADHYVTLPLTTLEPGDYLLKVEAKMDARVAGRRYPQTDAFLAHAVS